MFLTHMVTEFDGGVRLEVGEIDSCQAGCIASCLLWELGGEDLSKGRAGAYSMLDVEAAAMAGPSSGALLFHVWARSLRRSSVLDRTTDKDIRVLMKLTISEYCLFHLPARSDASRLSAALAALQGSPSTE